MSIELARGFIPSLDQYKDDGRFDLARRIQAKSTKELLEREIKQAVQFEADAKEIENEIKSARDVDNLIRLDKRIRDLPNYTVVIPGRLTRTQLDSMMNERLQIIVDEACKEAQTLNDIRSYTEVQRRLESLKKN